MKSPTDETLSILKRGCVEIISEPELVKKLKEGRPLRIKAGFDPTAPDLHLGHTVLLQKLKQFQDLEHEVIFLIGDFTAQIGDPSGRSETRPSLSPDEIQKNVVTYQEQVHKILDPDKTRIFFNSTWMKALSSSDIIRLASRYTVARMLERDDFEKRHKKGESIAIHEFLYPLLQGYDSVQLKSDVELGGTDQKFNLLVGRDLQRQSGQEPQVVMTLPLLVGTDGVQKMSKSYGNIIRMMDSAQEIFGKVMSLSDEVMWIYYELLSDLSSKHLEELKKAVQSGTEHPKKVKMCLAENLTSRFHGIESGRIAAQEFEAVFSHHALPKDIEELHLQASSEQQELIGLLVEIGLVASRSEARRMIQQGAVMINGKKTLNLDKYLNRSGEYLIQVGKRRFKKLHFS